MAKTWTFKYADRDHQWIRKVEDTEKDLIEVIKYGSKIFTAPNLYKKSSKKEKNMLYVSALDNILTALKGVRLFDRFGFNLPKSTEPTGTSLKKVKDFDEWQFIPSLMDWVSVYSGELLTEYKMPFELHYLLENNIDVQLE